MTLNTEYSELSPYRSGLAVPEGVDLLSSSIPQITAAALPAITNSIKVKCLSERDKDVEAWEEKVKAFIQAHDSITALQAKKLQTPPLSVDTIRHRLSAMVRKGDVKIGPFKIEGNRTYVASPNSASRTSVTSRPAKQKIADDLAGLIARRKKRNEWKIVALDLANAHGFISTATVQEIDDRIPSPTIRAKLKAMVEEGLLSGPFKKKGENGNIYVPASLNTGASPDPSTSDSQTTSDMQIDIPSLSEPSVESPQPSHLPFAPPLVMQIGTYLSPELSVYDSLQESPQSSDSPSIMQIDTDLLPELDIYDSPYNEL